MDEQNELRTPARTEEMENRLAKLEKLKEAGIDPFGRRFLRTHQASQISADFDTLENQEVTVAGRIMTMRGHGKACFADLADLSGTIQLYAKIDLLGEEAYEQFQELDLGDIIRVAGTVFRTRRGEISIQVHKWELLTKALRPFRKKWHGLKMLISVTANVTLT